MGLLELTSNVHVLNASKSELGYSVVHLGHLFTSNQKIHMQISNNMFVS